MKAVLYLVILSICMFSDGGIAQVNSRVNKVNKIKKRAKIQYGTASFYHNKFNGRKTASGDIFTQKKLTAAHNSVPLGTWVRVTNLQNNKTVVVKVIDRLHTKSSRLIDLSGAAAKKINFSRAGLLSVKVEVLGRIRPAVSIK